jgi:hypothetical protein
MMPRLPRLLLLLLSPVLLCLSCQAQGAARAYFYSEPDYRGECLVVDLNSSVYDLAKVRDNHRQKWDDRIASVRLEGPVVAVVFADPRYRGDVLEIFDNVRDLSGRRRGERGPDSWEARISSLKVELRQGPPPQAPRHFRSQRDADRMIRDAYFEILSRPPDEQGLRHYRHFLIEDGWSGETLRSDLRRSQEFRNRNVREIVIRCYREVLHREPDSDGMESYSRALREQGWTEQQLKNELKRSEEFRRSQGRR